MVGDLIAKKADFSCGDLSDTKERRVYIDFSVPLVSDFAQMYVSDTGPKTMWNTYLSVFDTQFWIILFTTILVFAIGIFILTKISNPRVENKEVIEESTSMPLKAVGNLDIGNWPTVTSKAVLVLVLSLFGLLIKETYSGSLMSAFTVKDHSLPFTSLKELSKDSEYALYFCSSGISLQYLTNSTWPWMRKIKDSKITPYLETNPHRFKSGKQCQTEFFKSDGAKKVLFGLKSAVIGYAKLGVDTCTSK